jgi:7-cyano-7-deazaguanine synthase
MRKKAVSLISGGLDSCVASYIAKDKGYDVFGISFRYGQRHEKEIDCSKKIVKSLDAKEHKIIDIDFNQFGKTSLLKSSSVEIEYHRLNNIGNQIPTTYVPYRNTVFLSISMSYAESIDADSIFIGVNSIDYSGYPDCRPEFIDAFQKMANLASKKSIEGKKIKIKTPLINLKKYEIIKIGSRLNIPFEETWSCYRGKEKSCGHCDSCLLRLKGFKEAKLKDPLQYEFLPKWYTI